MSLDKLFQKETGKLVYLNLKNNRTLFRKDVPLPIAKEDLLDGIRDHDFENEINLSFFIKGMVMNIAIDPEFFHIAEYESILSEMTRDKFELIFTEGLRAKEKDQIYYFRANYLMGYRNLHNSYYYAVALQNRYEQTKETLYLQESIRLLNEMIRQDENYPLSYLAFGNYEAQNNQYQKAYRYYELALEKLEIYPLDRHIKEEIKKNTEKNMAQIKPDKELLDAIEYSNRRLYQKSNALLTKLSEHFDTPSVKYYLARNYYQLGDLRKSESLFQTAYEEGLQDIHLFLDYSYLLVQLGKIKQSISLINEGLSYFPDDEQLLYNRAMIYLDQGMPEKAEEDLETILSYDDTDEMIYNNAMMILQKLKERR